MFPAPAIQTLMLQSVTHKLTFRAFLGLRVQWFLLNLL